VRLGWYDEKKKKGRDGGRWVFYTHLEQPTTKVILMIFRITFHDQDVLIIQLCLKQIASKLVFMSKWQLTHGMAKTMPWVQAGAQ
jgi:hypothetical protein